MEHAPPAPACPSGFKHMERSCRVLQLDSMLLHTGLFAGDLGALSLKEGHPSPHTTSCGSPVPTPETAVHVPGRSGKEAFRSGQAGQDSKVPFHSK
jgi:hypothetical protein